MVRFTGLRIATLAVLTAVLLVVAALGAASLSWAASVTATPQPSATPPLRLAVKAGALTLLTDPAQSETLFVGGAAPLALTPAGLELTMAAFHFSFPLKNGSFNPISLAGSFAAAGGFAFWGRQTMSTWTVLSFTDLDLTLGATSSVSAVFDSADVQGGLGRHTIMTLNTAHRHVTSFVRGGHHWLSISNIGASMTAWLQSQLTTAFAGYQPINRTLGSLTITVQVPAGVASPVSEATPAAAPTITSFSPTSGPVGTRVVLLGTGLAATTAVSFNGRPATFTFPLMDASDRLFAGEQTPFISQSLVAVVPAQATSGPIRVTTAAGTAITSTDFTVVPRPVVTLKLGGLVNGVLGLGKTITARGSVAPTSPSGSVIVTVQREVNGRWLAVTAVTRPLVTDGTYSWTTRPAWPGTYRVKTASVATTGLAAATTRWLGFTVRARLVHPSTAEIALTMAHTIEVGDPTEHFVCVSGAKSTALTISDRFGGSLTAAIGQRFPTADGYGQLVFFWHNDHFLGWDSVFESVSILKLRSPTTGEFVATYAHYAPSDPLYNPSLPPISAAYRWTGTKLIASGTPQNFLHLRVEFRH
jgi:hypothetical protein